MLSTVTVIGMAIAFLNPSPTRTLEILPPLITQELSVVEQTPAATSTIPVIPFYSQFKDISSPKWQGVGCGVTSLAMIIDYYKPNTVIVNTLLKEGITAGAFINNIGWSYQGLIDISRVYGFSGEAFDLVEFDKEVAFAKMETSLNEGPVIASVHYRLDPKNPIPHLIVVNGIKDNMVYYNDPAAKKGGLSIPFDDFIKAWKKRFIIITPQEEIKRTKFAQI